ncbi:MAG TPA: META domain-containing protein [Candidatus Limnocylindrales bacterium]|nr:META domain-containing protein [Candidatus Limnocylindrales bacterium]
MRRLLIGLTVVTLGLVTAACSSTSSGGSGGALDGTAWTLKTYDVSGTATAVPSGTVVDAKFAGGKVSGFAGCNVYSASAAISGATLKVGPTATTAMACEAAVTAVETAYLANLAKSATFTATADALTIFGGDGKQLLAYSAAPANPLEGEWNVTGFNTGTEAVTSPAAGTTLTATFTADGKIGGNAGCNSFTGAYTLDGTSLTVGPLATTMKACEQPVMDQEAQFLAALQTPTTVETSGTTVTLRDASGATQVVLGPK